MGFAVLFLARKKNGNAVYRNRCRHSPPYFLCAGSQGQKPVWAMLFVNDKAAEMTSARLHESAVKIFRKMHWVPECETSKESSEA